jgi:hypothetical protein
MDKLRELHKNNTSDAAPSQEVVFGICAGFVAGAVLATLAMRR